MNWAGPAGRVMLVTLTDLPTVTLDLSPATLIKIGTPGGTVMVRLPVP